MKKITKETIDKCLEKLKKESERFSNLKEDIYVNQVIAMYKHSDIYEYDVSEIYEEDHIFRHVNYENIFKNFIEEIKDSEEIEDNVQYIYEWFNDELNENIFYKLKDKNINNIDDAIKVIRPISFWMPLAIIINKKWHNTYSLGTEDEKGNLIGIRL
ncbi:hypothetical protein [Acinetobacter bereziniae]|uniref:hypothetical protein n=1 Tax=Acinetobacter bereziniae TaxID=106648 RepID=UPI0034CD2319